LIAAGAGAARQAMVERPRVAKIERYILMKRDTLRRICKLKSGTETEMRVSRRWFGTYTVRDDQLT